MCWLVVIASTFCSFAPSHLQKRPSCATVQDLMLQNTLLSRVKGIGCITKHYHPKEKGEYKLNSVTCADARKTDEKG